MFLLFLLHNQQEKDSIPCVQKRRRPPQSNWIRSFAKQAETTILWMDTHLSPPKTRKRRTKTTSNRGNKSLTTYRNLQFKVLQCDSSTDKNLTNMTNHLSFDNDVKVITNGNCCTASITNDIKDFVTPPMPVRAQVDVISGGCLAAHIGTVKWKIDDDLGQSHHLILSNTLLGSYRMLSPQHWTQRAKDYHPNPEGTGSLTTSKHVALFWKQNQFKRTIPLNTRNNVATITTSADNTCFTTYLSTLDSLHTDQHIIIQMMKRKTT